MAMSVSDAIFFPGIRVRLSSATLKKAGIILDLFQYAQFYYQLERETCRDILMRAFFLLQGITDSIAVGENLHFTDQQILSIMQRSVEDMVRGSQKRSTTR